MIARRTLLVAFLVALLWPQEQAWAQQPRRIGLLSANQFPQVFVEELAKFGWVEGRNVMVERRHAEGDVARLPALAAELVSLRVEVIVATAPPAVRAAQVATTSIPIVMTAVADPVGSGFVTSLAQPGGNITGLASTTGSGFMAKLLEVTKEAIPRAREVGIFFNTGNPLNYALASSEELIAAAAALDVRLHRFGVQGVDEFETAFAAAKAAGVAVLIVPGDPLIFRERQRLHDLAAQYGLATVHPTREHLAGRGLISYGPNLESLWRGAAPYVDRILRGARPAELPVEQPSTYELVVNLRRAHALGIEVPASLLARADEVIE